MTNSYSVKIIDKVQAFEVVPQPAITYLMWFFVSYILKSNFEYTCAVAILNHFAGGEIVVLYNRRVGNGIFLTFSVE